MAHTRSRRSVPVVSGLFLAVAVVFAVAPLASAGGQGGVTAQFAGTHAFVYTGAPEDWTVPNGVTSIVARVCGASGQNESLADSPGIKFAGRPGHGGCVTGNVRVAPGDVIHVRVGGFAVPIGPLSDSGWPDGGAMTCPAIDCGGGGGGSSDIRIGGDTLVDRVMVGGGGGGGGGGKFGGSGGNAGGGTGTIGFNGADGGDGAGFPDQIPRGTGGGGGQLNQTWNGGCGVANPPAGATSCAHGQQPNWGYVPGLAGTDNKGGDGPVVFEGAVGGGGGGGYFGGGSGCGYHGDGNLPPNQGACGGGGGSSFADPTRTGDVFLEQGTAQWYLDFLAGITTAGDNGTVTFSWPGLEVPAFTPTTVAATTTAPTTTTAAPTTTAATTTDPTTAEPTTTIDRSLPATGSGGSSFPPAIAALLVGGGLVLVARRRPT